ncbi:hypothetical protein [Lewinella sp. W8]|uniref:hypothetical protein n=1 Tax=Lewinella sp. W8 TaxID=2528208 RepID=UPI001067416A|nr:hypothetical protein [Lewinella sp. W8]MTB49752.1 hypothetical protein [Lewinella sp. W8]
MITVELRIRHTEQAWSGQKIAFSIVGPKRGWTKTMTTNKEGKVTFRIKPGNRAILYHNGVRKMICSLKECNLIYHDFSEKEMVSPPPGQRTSSFIPEIQNSRVAMAIAPHALVLPDPDGLLLPTTPSTVLHRESFAPALAPLQQLSPVTYGGRRREE